MMDKIEVDIIADVCPEQIHVTPPCWMNHEKNDIKDSQQQLEKRHL